MMDLIERQKAIEALCNECQGRCIPCDSYPCSEVEAINALPSAQPKIEERKEEFAQNVPKEDLISRKAAIDAIGKTSDELYENIKKGATFPQRQWFDGMAQAQSILENLPSVQPEIKPISYQDCANAMMMMWMDDVLTDGEYRRIMDKLNDHESRRENRC